MKTLNNSNPLNSTSLGQRRWTTLLLAALVWASASIASAQTKMLQFDFAGSGTTTTDSVAGVTLNLLDYSGAASDLHTASGTGPGGYGKSLNFTSATGQGGNGPIAQTTANSAINFGTVSNFTMAMWVNPSASWTSSGFSRFMVLGANGTTDLGGSFPNALGFLANNASGQAGFQGYVGASGSASPYGNLNVTVGQWMFVAVTYSNGVLQYYTGSTNNAASLFYTSTYGSVPAAPNVGSSFSLSLGNRISNRQRSFYGYLARASLYRGAAAADYIEMIRQGAFPLSTLPSIMVAGGATLDAGGGLTLAANQNLTGSGTIVGNVTNSSTSQILPGGAGTIGTLTFSNDLALVNGGQIVYDFNASTNDIVSVLGSLSPSGVTSINLASAPPGGFPNGTNVLMYVSGTLGGSAANFQVLGLATRKQFNVVYDNGSSPKRVLLVVSGGSSANIVWQGDVLNGVNNAWDINLSSNWVNGGNSDVYFDLDNVSFTDAGTNSLGTINDPTLDVVVTPSAVVFNSSSNYSLASPLGTGQIAGSGKLTKSGAGKVTITTTNTYTGGTLVNGGILAVGSTGALGNPGANPLVVVTNSGSFDISGKLFTSATQPIVVAGSGSGPTTGSLFSSSGMGCTIGCGVVGIRSLRLAGDTSIGNNGGAWQIGTSSSANGSSPGLLDGQGFSLTKIGNNTLVLECTSVSAPSQFVIAGGGVVFANASGGVPGLGGCPIVISNNAWLNFWDNKDNNGLTLASAITVGEGGAQFRNTFGPYYGHAYYNTFNGAVALNGPLTIENTSSFGGAPGNVPTWGKMTFNGVISGSNGVVCIGPFFQYSSANHTVTFTGNNTYSGLTVLSNWITLQTTAANQSGGGYLVGDLAVLDVVPVGGKPTLPMASLTLGEFGGSTVSFERLSVMPTTPLIYATNLTINVVANIKPPVAGYSVGQFPLIRYDGTIGGAGFAGLVLGTLPRGVSAVLVDNTANKTIDLLVNATGIVWTGTNSPAWDIATTLNWFDPASLSETYFYDGDGVRFDDTTASNNVLIAATVSPSGITVSGTNNYYFGGPAGISGAATLIKNGSGTLTVANTNNTFTGGTVINAGTLKLEGRNFNWPPYGGALNESGGLVTINSGGTLDVNGLQVPNFEQFGPAGYNVFVSGAGVGNNGAIYNGTTTNNDNACPGSITLVGDASIGGPGDINIRHGGAPKLFSQSGAYTLTKVGAGSLRLRYTTEVSTNFGDVRILQGIVSYESSSTNGFGDPTKTIFVGNGGGFALGTASAPFKKQIVCSNGASLYAFNTQGNVIATPVLLEGGEVTIRANYYNSITFSNVLSGAGGITLSFNSLATFAASNTYSGNTTVANCNNGNGSVLRLVGNGSIANSPNITLFGIVPGQSKPGAIDASGRIDGTLTLVSGQTLRGDDGSYVKGDVVASSGATITPGGLANIQWMSFSNNLTLTAGTVAAFDLNADTATNDLANVAGTLTYGGATLQVTNLGAGALVAGQSFKLFNAASYAGNIGTVVPSTPGAGLAWNFAPSSGTLSVVSGVASNPTNITYSASGGVLTLSWPADHLGWFLQTQTNSRSVGLSSNWFDLPGTDTVTATNFTVTPADPTVFFRLRHP